MLPSEGSAPRPRYKPFGEGQDSLATRVRATQPARLREVEGTDVPHNFDSSLNNGVYYGFAH
jgi:hypothetical protein